MAWKVLILSLLPNLQSYPLSPIFGPRLQAHAKQNLYKASTSKCIFIKGWELNKKKLAYLFWLALAGVCGGGKGKNCATAL